MQIPRCRWLWVAAAAVLVSTACDGDESHSSASTGGAPQPNFRGTGGLSSYGGSQTASLSGRANDGDAAAGGAVLWGGAAGGLLAAQVAGHPSTAVLTDAAGAENAGGPAATSGVGNTASIEAGSAGTSHSGSASPGMAGAETKGEVLLLSQSGLYELDMKTIRADVVPFTPRFELWSDSATKRRWLYLPPGTTIDTSDPDYWKFPIGTKVWKEFSKNGKRIETRLIERVSSRNYRMMAYQWTEDLSEAVAVPDGQVNAMGTDHDIPNSTDCETCHNHQPGRIVGVGAIQLDYDGAGLSLTSLQARGLLSHSIPTGTKIPGDETAQAALGLLHVNCGTCHNPNSVLPYKTLDLWQRVSMAGEVTTTPFYLSTVGVASGTNPDPNSPATLVVPGHPELSALMYRMNSRATGVAMPPLGSKRVDDAGVETVSAFIQSLD